MDINKLANHCSAAWQSFALKHGIHRPDEFYLLKLQEELGELTRSYMELKGMEKSKHNDDLAKIQQFHGDCASVIGNALIMGLHFKVDLVEKIQEKFPL